MNSLRINHPSLGLISVVERKGSSKLSARWVNGELHINIPAGLSRIQIAETIERHRSDFEGIRPLPRFSSGMRLRLDGGIVITITAGDASMNDVRLRISPTSISSFIIELPPLKPVASPEIQKRIDACLKAICRHVAPKILIPRARTIAGRLGLKVDKWEISHGKTTLGLCFPKEKRIKLSYMCMFLSDELRDYIICHELAHLTEPGHTPSFHALCDRYCSGRESELRTILRHYTWPVDR